MLNGVYGFLIESFVLAAVMFAGYSIWDNSQIYRSAENVQAQIRQLKPDQYADDGPSFDELRAVNEDVAAWLTVNDTNIDYPVLHGENNLTYMNKDVYGEFSLAGSIFLDSRNKPDFSDSYSIIYGHNMEQHLMFGDLALFKEKDFFKEHTEATILLPNEVRDYGTVAILQISAGTDEIFNTDHWDSGFEGFDEFLTENSIWYRSELIDLIKSKPNGVEIVALATCSAGNTNDRTVLILIREKPGTPTGGDEDEPPPGKDTPDDPHQTGDSTIHGNGPKPTGDSQNVNFWLYVIAGSLLFILIFESMERYLRRYK